MDMGHTVAGHEGATTRHSCAAKCHLGTWFKEQPLVGSLARQMLHSSIVVAAPSCLSAEWPVAEVVYATTASAAASSSLARALAGTRRSSLHGVHM